jgi:hypothetical protein
LNGKRSGRSGRSSFFLSWPFATPEGEVEASDQIVLSVNFMHFSLFAFLHALIQFGQFVINIGGWIDIDEMIDYILYYRKRDEF